MNIWDIVNAISQTKVDIWDDTAAKVYEPFMVNRALSQHPDILLAAQEMNLYPDLDKDMQYAFLFHTVPGRKRYSGKWGKKDPEDENIALAQEYFQLSRDKARDAVRILSPDQLQEIRFKLEKGGLEK